jgi:aminoglycoside phosphotransferase (APT) family kinase protein
MSELGARPAAGGVRVPYDALPGELQAWVEGVLGSRVTAATTQPGGFSPGVAARLRCADGRRAFLKAVSAEANAESPSLHRREIEVLRVLPPDLPVPRLISSYDEHPWVAILIEDVDGRHPHLPWRPDELRTVMKTMDRLSAALTPCPLADAAMVGEAWRPEFTKWRGAVEAPPPGLDDWSLRHLDRLAELEAQWETAASGDTLLHLDLRADNMIVTADQVWVADWPWAARGNPVFDVIGLCPSVGMQGGPEPDELLAMSAVARAADPAVVTVLAATVAGYFVVGALEPPPPGLPTVRSFQAAQGEVALRWLQQRTGWR